MTLAPPPQSDADATVSAPPDDAAPQAYRRDRIAHWDDVARKTQRHEGAGRYYHRRLAEIYRFLIPPGQRVLELGCGRGDLLAALRPSVGVGVDLSPEMVRHAHARHAGLRFVQADALDLAIAEP